ncbi:HIT family protein [Phycicoccus sp. SLBN-51]|uniref:HIT family protein n=1 Tax=Phycicoccus sp. SLBN-51 TaxID=2768447 RepID=UPI00114EABA3|nr:HIT family protein [Phycicoccus sp. SLBN-51]TQJ52237.1 histidine triad (HIT) family protein [Phycicoccus sp. SLBN-51]
MVTESGCPFCAVIRGEDPQARELYRDANVVAFFPLAPATRGHTLLVPRRHVTNVWELSQQEAQALATASVTLARTLRDALQPDGLNVIQSNGQAATQSVPHVHVHLVPRYTGDRMTLGWPKGPAETSDEQDRTLHSIKRHLSPFTADPSPEDRRQHLSFIQSVVTRMSQASSSAKTWLLPIVTATYGYALTKDSPNIAILGLMAVLLFGVLDANYLKQERAFRGLYDRVAEGGPIPPFAMNPTLAAPEGSKVNYWPDRRDIRSWAIAPVYGPLLAVGIGIVTWGSREGISEWPEVLVVLSAALMGAGLALIGWWARDRAPRT